MMRCVGGEAAARTGEGGGRGKEAFVPSFVFQEPSLGGLVGAEDEKEKGI